MINIPAQRQPPTDNPLQNSGLELDTEIDLGDGSTMTLGELLGDTGEDDDSAG